MSLKVGKLQVDKITTNPDTGKILTQVPFDGSNGFITNSPSYTTGGFISEYIPGGSSPKSYMVVPEGGTPIKLDGIKNELHATTSTGTLSPYDINQKIQHPPFALGYRPLADKIAFTHTGAQASTVTGTLSVTFQNYGADSYRLSFGTGQVGTSVAFSDPNPFYTGALLSTGAVTITGVFRYYDDLNTARTYTLQVCYRQTCSAHDIKNLTANVFDWGPFPIASEKKAQIQNTVVGDITPPIAGADTVTTAFNTNKMDIDVLENDSDDSQVPLTLT